MSLSVTHIRTIHARGGDGAHVTARVYHVQTSKPFCYFAEVDANAQRVGRYEGIDKMHFIDQMVEVVEEIVYELDHPDWASARPGHSVLTLEQALEMQT